MVFFTLSKDPQVIDSGTSTSRKFICMADVNTTNEELKALISFYAMTSSDYVSSFLKKGKLTWWKKMTKKNTI